VDSHKKEKRKLPEREFQIALRLREARQFLRLTQKEFGAQIAVGRERIASYEEARVPLRWEIALKLCRQFFISERWLATGAITNRRAERRTCHPFGHGYPRFTASLATNPLVRHLQPGRPFSEIYDTKLAQEYSDLTNRVWHSPVAEVLESDDFEYIQNALDCVIQSWKNSLPDYLGKRFLLLLMNAGDLLFNDLKEVPTPIKSDWPYKPGNLETAIRQEMEILHAAQLGKKKGLTETSIKRKLQGMKSPMKVLLGQVADLSKGRGKKLALAKFIGVNQSRVSEWLRGKNEPGGEITLHLLEWVAAQEGEHQKTLGDVEAVTKGETRSTHSRYEKRKTGPRR
jgi:transcriptional regulator with XRE-family HTH domain